MAKSIFFHVDKIKSPYVMGKRCIHYTRKKHDEPHIDYSLTKDNEYFAGSEQDNFNDLFKKKIKSLDYYNKHCWPSNGVMAFDILARFPDELSDGRNKGKFEQWKKITVDYINERFGKENIANMVLHVDEPDSTPHIHAVAFPVSGDHFIANAIVNGPGDVRKMQNEYAELCKPLGYDRGIVNSPARSQGGKKIQNVKKRAFGTAPPEILKGETAEQYRDRISEEWEELRAANVLKDNTIKRSGDLRETAKKKDKHIAGQQKAIDDLTEELASKDEALHQVKRREYALKHGISTYQEEEREKLQRVYDLLNSSVVEKGEADLRAKDIDIDAAVEK